MKLTIKWDNFLNQLDTFVSEGKVLLEFENSIQTEQEFEKTKTEIKTWKESCFEFLKSSFDKNEFAISFHNARQERFHIGNQKKDYRQIKTETFQDLKEKINMLVYFKRILSISDAIIKPEIVELIDRNLYTTEQTLELILDKLYDLYDNSYHSISTILEGNGVTQKRHGEDRELLKMLEDNGYVSAMHMRDSAGQLTLRGKLYVEEKRKAHKENYNDINKSQEEINERVDEIIEKLTKLGYGQEIIFDEIQELKELYTTLNKKNWGQLVKGKVVDLALSKLVENDTLSYIYEKLTDHTLRLP
ncbi:hypothetical protein [Flavobacterium psychrolimnae]|uniref:Uncharacterized protein n=1 Tax=Flavobacterium psychrolimnae TaxID=249351 RepID=A0A366AX78_9FLAO|nr:hypothetical protein [Flavobacterium psychrolimnae]RBN49479.1 hypothetical protein DR980_13640 [Flavobacterium psychrolimnae]